SPTRWLDLDVGYRRGLNDQTYRHSVMGGVTARW
ncbi:MAG: transporter, partial [Burkholderia sp.]|nr:transporter [Burkholderia sp.]